MEPPETIVFLRGDLQEHERESLGSCATLAHHSTYHCACVMVDVSVQEVVNRPVVPHDAHVLVVTCSGAGINLSSHVCWPPSL